MKLSSRTRYYLSLAAFAVGLVLAALGGVQLVQLLLQSARPLAVDAGALGAEMFTLGINAQLTYIMAVWVLPGAFVASLGAFFADRIWDRETEILTDDDE